MDDEEEAPLALDPEGAWSALVFHKVPWDDDGTDGYYIEIVPVCAKYSEQDMKEFALKARDMLDMWLNDLTTGPGVD